MAIQKTKRLREEKKSERKHEKRIAKEKAKEQAIKESEKKLLEMQDKFSKNARTKIDREIWKEQPISDFSGDMKGILDPSRITMLTTNDQMKHSELGKQFEDHKQVPFETKEMIMNSYGFEYTFDRKDQCTYSQEYVDLAMKSMENPKVYFRKDYPLIIKDDTYTYMIAPRVEVEDFPDDDDVKETKQAQDSRIKLSQTEYKELMKSMKKEEMIAEFKKLEEKYPSEGEVNIHDKHQALYNLLQKKKEAEWHQKHTKKEAKKPIKPSQKDLDRIEKEKMKYAKVEKKGKATITTYPKSTFVQPKDKKKKETKTAHTIKIKDLRPIGKKNTRMCTTCGATGKNLTKYKTCEDYLNS